MNIRAIDELLCKACGHELDPSTREPIHEIVDKKTKLKQPTSNQTDATTNPAQVVEVCCDVCKRSRITRYTYILEQEQELKYNISNNYYDIILDKDQKEYYIDIINNYNSDLRPIYNNLYTKYKEIKNANVRL